VLSQVEDSLAAHRLLGWRPWFRVVAKVGKFERAEAWYLRVRAGHSALAMLRDIRDGRFLHLKLTVPEGYTSVDIAETVSPVSRPRRTRFSPRSRPCPASRIRHHRTECGGYLAPDTYSMPRTARDVRW
jgi:cell division protein YceG involved in septum cleavage